VTSEPLRVLCLDIEGGYGGSSRSLFHLLKHIDRSRILPEVWCRRAGPIVSMYEGIGITVRVQPDLPKVSSLPRFSRNVWVLLQYFVAFASSRSARRKLAAVVNERFNVVHFNHEAFYYLAAWLRPRVKAAFVMHNRTMLRDTWFARRQARFLVGTNDINVFITEQERENVRQLAGWGGGVVIYNVVDIPKFRPQPHPEIQRDGRFTVACLSNYSWMRGTDRLVEVAAALRAMGRKDVRFVVAGDYHLSGTLPGGLGRVAANDGDLSDYARARGVGDDFLFLGHVSEPERVLASSDVLAKLTREDNPWGRDILEALSMGLPVFACGTYDRFVKPNVNGFLYPHSDGFDPVAVARDILDLASDSLRKSRMSEAAVESVRIACDGPSRAEDLMGVWEEAHAIRGP